MSLRFAGCDALMGRSMLRPSMFGNHIPHTNPADAARKAHCLGLRLTLEGRMPMLLKGASAGTP